MTDTRPFLSLSRAHAICADAMKRADEMGVSIAVAVADAGGHLLEFHRMDGAGAGAVDIVTGKARTAAMFGLPTKVLDELCTERPGFTTSGAVTIEGGVPIEIDNHIVGAVAVGGLSPDRDAEIATEAAKA